MNASSEQSKSLTDHVTVCLIAIRHSNGLILAKVNGWIRVVWRGDFESVDVRNGARVGEVGIVGKPIDERRELGDVDEVDFWSRIRLVGVEIIIQTLCRGGESCDAGRCCLC